MTIVSDADNSLLRSLREISARLKVSPALGEHLAHYFADADVAAFGDASPEDLHGAAVQHHRLGAARQPGQAAVALYTPDFDRHGWHNSHSVLDIVTDDMPFLVDSVTQAIYRHGLTIHHIMHPLLGVERDAKGALSKTHERGSTGSLTESWIHIEFDRISDPAQVDALRQDVESVLADVRAAVEDADPMRQRIGEAIAVQVR